MFLVCDSYKSNNNEQKVVVFANWRTATRIIHAEEWNTSKWNLIFTPDTHALVCLGMKNYSNFTLKKKNTSNLLEHNFGRFTHS